MTRFLRFACVGVAVAGLASVGNAQICAGTPSFSVGGGRLGGNAMFSDNSKTYGGQLALGTQKALFATGSFSHAEDNNSDGSSNAYGGALGYQFELSPGQSVQLCPMVGVTAQEGSLIGNVPVLLPKNTLDISVGASVGWVASNSDDMQVIPAVGAAIVARSYKDKIVYSGQGNPSTTDSFGLLTGTIGFVFNKRCTISPIVQIPVSESNGKVSYGVAVSYNFSLPKGMHM